MELSSEAAEPCRESDKWLGNQNTVAGSNAGKVGTAWFRAKGIVKVAAFNRSLGIRSAVAEVPEGVTWRWWGGGVEYPSGTLQVALNIVFSLSNIEGLTEAKRLVVGSTVLLSY